MARTSRATDIGREGLTGWRKKVGAAVAGPVSQRTTLSGEQVEAVVGAAFFALSLYYVISVARAAARH